MEFRRGAHAWYRVGSAHEPAHQQGFAHLFEHLMFEGSEHQPDGYFRPLQEIGARVNGSTNKDRTNYYEQVPAQYLEAMLWTHRERMAFPVVDQEVFDRDVVLVPLYVPRRIAVHSSRVTGIRLGVDVYHVDLEHDVRDFLVTDPRFLALSTSDDGRVAGEKLLVRQDGDDLDLALFLDDELLARLDDRELRGERRRLRAAAARAPRRASSTLPARSARAASGA